MEQTFLSKDNTTNLYKLLIKNYSLEQADKGKKRNLIETLVHIMKENYETLNFHKINNKNISSIKQQYNNICIQQAKQYIMNHFNLNNKVNNSVGNFNRAVSSRGNKVDTTEKFENLKKLYSNNPSIGTNSLDQNINNYNSTVNNKNTKNLSGNLSNIDKDSVSGYLKNDNFDNVSTVKYSTSKLFDDSIPLQDRLAQMEQERNISNTIPLNVNNSPLNNQQPINDQQMYRQSLSPVQQQHPVQQQPPVQQQHPVQQQPPVQQQHPVQQQYPVQQQHPVQQQYPMQQSPIPHQVYQPLVSEQSVQPPVQQSIQPPVQQSIQPPVQQSIQPPVQPPVQHPVQQSIQPPVQPPVQQSIQQLNEYTDEKNEQNRNLGNKIREIYYLDLNIVKTASEYNYKFNEIRNVKSIRLRGYSLPNVIYNVKKSQINYEILLDNVKSVFEIDIPTGHYTEKSLINKLNTNEHLEFYLNEQYKICVRFKNIETNVKDGSIVKVNHFKFYQCDLLKNLGLNNYDICTFCEFDNILDLRVPIKLNLELLNLNSNLNVFFNETMSNFKLVYDTPINLNCINYRFNDKDNSGYDFNELPYELYFELEINS
uniref:Uncharacterized protein n=1 Tax=Megaviridae environmental sample TaxID=1737588 RepID=A0A5J6VJJ4_9VIRU|nr:MAG: hypothetical protein [Megaviridae environmental sample]